MSSFVNNGHQADLANQLRKQFIRLQDEGNLEPWVLPPAKMPAAHDKWSNSSFPPLIVYDSFQEASKIYRTSPKSRLRMCKQLGGNFRAATASSLGDAPLHKLQGETANPAFVKSFTRLPRIADDSWAILARNLAKEKASKITHALEWDYQDFSRGGNLQGDAKSAFVRSPSRMADNSWGILAAAVAKERVSKLDDAAPTRRCCSSVSKPVANNETPPQGRSGDRRTSGRSRSEMSGSRSPAAARSQGLKVRESTSPIARVDGQGKDNSEKELCKARTKFQPSTVATWAQDKEREWESKFMSGHDMGFPATKCLKARDDSISSGASFVSTPLARSKGDVSVHGTISRRGQFDSTSGLFLSPTISSQCKVDAPRSPIARALLKEKELKLLESLKKREAGARPESDCPPRRSRSGLAVSPSRSIPSKAVDTGADTSLANARALTAMEREQKLPVAKKLRPETPDPIDSKQLRETVNLNFQPGDGSNETNCSSKEEPDGRSAQKKFTDCTKNSDRMSVTANVCEQLTNTRVVRLISRIIDDIWPAVSKEVVCSGLGEIEQLT